MQVKTFDEAQNMFGPFWFYLTALSMTKDLLDVLFPESRHELPVAEHAESQTKKEKENCSRNRMVMGGLLWNNIDFPEMGD